MRVRKTATIVQYVLRMIPELDDERILLNTMSRNSRILRRQFLLGMMASGLASTASSVKAAGAAQPATLRAIAERSGLFWGSAVQADQIRQAADFAQAVARECSVIVPEWEMKWGAIEGTRGRRNFARSDIFLKFAETHRLKIRGTTLVWHRNIPKWALEALKDKPDWNLLASYMTATLDRYGGDRFIHWDVLNEVIEPRDGREDALRLSPYLSAFGPEYLPRALALAHERAPKVQLYVNEYGLDYDGKIERDRRTALLRLIERLKKANAPFHGIGIQAHLRLDKSPFSENALRRFLADIAAHGLKITLTELDVRERDLSLPIEERDRLVAREVTRYLDVVLDEPAVAGIVTWGLSDRYSWLNAKLQGGARNRGLPLDEHLAPKPVRHAMAEALARRASR
jgi:endo-1,4-beta-xylanase